MSTGVDAAIAQGLVFIASKQEANGSFGVELSNAKHRWRPIGSYQTVFAPALMLSTLSGLDNPIAQNIRQKLAKWLMSQKSSAWSFNYWATGAPESNTLPYPDDLDDTACALIGLQLHDRALLSPEGLASIVKLLVSAESQVGGPYRTWLVGPGSAKIWQDIDLAVNSNLAYLLSLVGASLPKLNKYLELAIASRRLVSPYYPSWHILAYYLSRACPGPVQQQLVDLVLRKRTSNGWGSPLKTSLAVLALRRLEFNTGLANDVTELIGSQDAQGSWPAEPLWLDPARTDKKHYAGSAALTTAFVIEALASYERRLSKGRKVARPQTSSDASKQALADVQHYGTIMSLAKKQLAPLDPVLRRAALNSLEQMRRGDSNQEIVLLPILAARSLDMPIPKLNNKLLYSLGAANLFGWAAYTIYDDFLDNEGAANLLPVANVCLRYSLDNFKRALPNQVTFQREVAEAFNSIDGANAWEMAHCRSVVVGDKIALPRLPAYSAGHRLADRSLGHYLTPLAILVASGIDLKGSPALHIKRAFRHYLIARQLNDDLHDWELDLKSGRLSYVVTAILKKLDVAADGHLVSELLPLMQKQFWHHTLTAVTKIILRHTSLAQQAAQRSQLLTTDNFFDNLLGGINAATHRTLDEQTRAKDFLRAYSAQR